MLAMPPLASPPLASLNARVSCLHAPCVRACSLRQSVRDIMQARIEAAASMKCDAIEPDNMSVSIEQIELIS